MWDLSSPSRDLTHAPCLGSMDLDHWTAREGPIDRFLESMKLVAAVELRCNEHPEPISTLKTPASPTV